MRQNFWRCGRGAALLFALMAAQLATAQPLAAQDTSLAQMRERDRLGRPAEELAAWRAFAAPLLARSGIDPAERAEARLGLATSLLYTKHFAEGLAEVEAGRVELALLATPPRFMAELHATAALLLTELGRLDEAEAEGAPRWRWPKREERRNCAIWHWRIMRWPGWHLRGTILQGRRRDIALRAMWALPRPNPITR